MNFRAKSRTQRFLIGCLGQIKGKYIYSKFENIPGEAFEKPNTFPKEFFAISEGGIQKLCQIFQGVLNPFPPIWKWYERAYQLKCIANSEKNFIWLEKY